MKIEVLGYNNQLKGVKMHISANLVQISRESLNNHKWYIFNQALISIILFHNFLTMKYNQKTLLSFLLNHPFQVITIALAINYTHATCFGLI